MPKKLLKQDQKREIDSGSDNQQRVLIDVNEESLGVIDKSTVIHDLSEIGIVVANVAEENLNGITYALDEHLCQLNDFENTRSDVIPRLEEDMSSLQWNSIYQKINYSHLLADGTGIRIAVIGSGIYEKHPDIQSSINVDKSRNMTIDGGSHQPIGFRTHATHIAGIISCDNSINGIKGIAPNTEIRDYRVVSGTGILNGDLLAAIVDSAKSGCDIANISLNLYPYNISNHTDVLIEGLNRASKFAEQQGMLIVSPAGNEGVDLSESDQFLSLPNQIRGIMSISATSPVGFSPTNLKQSCSISNSKHHYHTPAPYTNYGEGSIDISAPGGRTDHRSSDTKTTKYDGIISTSFNIDLNTNSYDQENRVPVYEWKSGTSFAAPHVSGAAALIMELRPDFTPLEVREHLSKTADQLGKTQYHGKGHLNINAAVQSLV